MKQNLSDFDELVARYYAAVFHLAIEITPTPMAAMKLTNRVFEASRPGRSKAPALTGNFKPQPGTLAA